MICSVNVTKQWISMDDFTPTEPAEDDRSTRVVRVSRLEDQGTEDDVSHLTPGERIMMVWELTKTAWDFMGEPFDEPMRRDVVRVIRRQDDHGEYAHRPIEERDVRRRRIDTLDRPDAVEEDAL